MAHGYAKVVHGPDAFAGVVAAMGMPAPSVLSWTTIMVEILGGLAVLCGVLIPFVSLPMAAVLIVAMATVHWPYGFSSITLQSFSPAGAKFGPPGYEVDLLYLFGLISLVLSGPGPFSVPVRLRFRCLESFAQEAR